LIEGSCCCGQGYSGGGNFSDFGGYATNAISSVDPDQPPPPPRGLSG
jgi:hypothetical protein